MMNFINKKLTYEELIYKEFSVESVKSYITIIGVKIRSKVKNKRWYWYQHHNNRDRNTSPWKIGTEGDGVGDNMKCKSGFLIKR